MAQIRKHGAPRRACIAICAGATREKETFVDAGRTAGAWKALTAATSARTAAAHFIVTGVLCGAESGERAVRKSESSVLAPRTANGWRDARRN